MGLANTFARAHDHVSYKDRGVIEIHPPLGDNDTPEKWDARVVNFRDILETGEAPIYTEDNQYRSSYGNQYIDWNSNDEFTQALKTIENSASERIENNPELQMLLKKDHWTREDRVSWEKGVSEIISEEHNKIPGLNEYRNEVNKEEYPTVERRATRLNDLSQDIKNDTKTIEHDCESHSIVEGAILQKMDNKFLPENGASEDDYKIQSNYFYAVGNVNFSKSNPKIGGHAFIVSSATGNVIESTNDPDDKYGPAYKKNLDPNFTFEEFVKEGISVNKDGTIYGGYNLDSNAASLIRIEQEGSSLEKVYDKIAILVLKGDLPKTGEDIASVSPELQKLSEIIKGHQEYEESLHMGPGFHNRADYYTEIMDIARNGKIYDIIEDTKYVEIPYTMEDVMDAAVEMHPNNVNEVLSDFILDDASTDTREHRQDRINSFMEEYEKFKGHPSDTAPSSIKMGHTTDFGNVNHIYMDDDGVLSTAWGNKNNVSNYQLNDPEVIEFVLKELAGKYENGENTMEEIPSEVFADLVVKLDNGDIDKNEFKSTLYNYAKDDTLMNKYEAQEDEQAAIPILPHQVNDIIAAPPSI